MVMKGTNYLNYNQILFLANILCIFSCIERHICFKASWYYHYKKKEPLYLLNCNYTEYKFDHDPHFVKLYIKKFTSDIYLGPNR